MSILDNHIREWLDEPVWWTVQRIPRKIVLHRFVKDGLVCFIRSCGYELGRTVRELYTDIATGLYLNYYAYKGRSVWMDEPYNTEPIPEDRIHFNDVIGFDRWATFWSAWLDWSDLSPDFPNGRERQMDIEEFVWRQLDLDNSPQTEVLYYRMHQELDEDAGDEFGRGPGPGSGPAQRSDVYLEEAAGWGGYRR
jgi:hypothetical protein